MKVQDNQQRVVSEENPIQKKGNFNKFRGNLSSILTQTMQGSFSQTQEIGRDI